MCQQQQVQLWSLPNSLPTKPSLPDWIIRRHQVCVCRVGSLSVESCIHSTSVGNHVIKTHSKRKGCSKGSEAGTLCLEQTASACWQRVCNKIWAGKAAEADEGLQPWATSHLPWVDAVKLGREGSSHDSMVPITEDVKTRRCEFYFLEWKAAWDARKF